MTADAMSPPAPLTQLTEDEQDFRMMLRTFAETELKPLVMEMDESQQFNPELLQKFHDLGIMAIEPPEEYGGAGGTFFMSILAIEELSRVDPSAAVVVDVQNTLVLNALLKWGNDELKGRIVRDLCNGHVGAYALSEPSSGSDAFALRTRARRQRQSAGAFRRARGRGSARDVRRG